MATQKTSPWSNSEVRFFLCLVAADRIQVELDGATRNEKVFRELACAMAAHGYERTSKQCREKLKKLKYDYRAIKFQNSKTGVNVRKDWKWFPQMDAIYGYRPAGHGRESGLDKAVSALLGGESIYPNQGFSTFMEPPSFLAFPPTSAAAEPGPTPEHGATSEPQQLTVTGNRKWSGTSLELTAVFAKNKTQRSSMRELEELRSSSTNIYEMPGQVESIKKDQEEELREQQDSSPVVTTSFCAAESAQSSPQDVESSSKQKRRSDIRPAEVCGRLRDEDELFLLSLLPSFKRLCTKKRMEVRMKFQQALYDAEFDD